MKNMNLMQYRRIMVFDKKGELLQENIGYLSNEVAEEWIEEALGN